MKYSYNHFRMHNGVADKPSALNKQLTEQRMFNFKSRVYFYLQTRRLTFIYCTNFNCKLLQNFQCHFLQTSAKDNGGRLERLVM